MKTCFINYSYTVKNAGNILMLEITYQLMHVRMRAIPSLTACGRHYASTVIGADRSSKAVRETFINYFVRQHNHKFIRSSPVVPYCDPTVAFVNAGMNQFKGVFLNRDAAPSPRVTNSQKCIRVGGKHNDLDAVGLDSYHHTFFEMLGSWSFGDYFKKEACEMAWNLLTGPYALLPERLYVTYFAGDKKLALEPDVETKQLWEEVGVPAGHILPFGMSDNFWEMGPTGPCGPCTEIHVDHVSGRRSAAERVNRGHADVTELWNLVFIQYSRDTDGQLTLLPQRHVDTGMGLERLTAVLQGRHSNYDTDLFQPLFLAIHKRSRRPAYAGTFGHDGSAPLDSAYRLLADHARMVTVALADGMFPDQNHKLRRILRKALLVSKKCFGVDRGLLSELTNYVAESLADTYPEVGTKLEQVRAIIVHEEELLQSLMHGAAARWRTVVAQKPALASLDVTEMPGLVAGYHDLVKVSQELARCGSPAVMSGDMAFKLYDTFGLDERTIAEVAALEGLSVNMEEFKVKLNHAKFQTRESFVGEDYTDTIEKLLLSLRKSGIRPTLHEIKYNYRRDERGYHFPAVGCKVEAVIVNGSLVKEASVGAECALVLDQTNMYHEAGGQSSDRGTLLLSGGQRLVVSDVLRCGEYVIHKGKLEGGSVSPGDTGIVQLDTEHRLANMRNHTATHLLNATLRQLLVVICQKSSRVTPTHLTFDFAVYGGSVSSEHLLKAERIVQQVIDKRVPVLRRVVTTRELLAADRVTLLPGQVYPEEGIYFIDISTDDFTSREPCCGTHVLNTADIERVCMLSGSTTGVGTRTVRAVTGPHVAEAVRAGELLVQHVADITGVIQQWLDMTPRSVRQAEVHYASVEALRREVAVQDTVPYAVFCHSLAVLDGCLESLKKGIRESVRASLESEMHDVLSKLNDQANGSAQPFLVHFLSCSSGVDSVPLQKATKLCPDLPVLLLVQSKGLVKARCCVPQRLVSERFNAELWMRPVLDTLKAQGSAPRGQDPRLVFNMKGRQLLDRDADHLMAAAVRRAEDMAKRALAATTKLN